jgi:hypothetical protein
MMHGAKGVEYGEDDDDECGEEEARILDEAEFFYVVGRCLCLRPAQRLQI